jgi:hypothetical protein
MQELVEIAFFFFCVIKTVLFIPDYKCFIFVPAPVLPLVDQTLLKLPLYKYRKEDAMHVQL